MELQQAKVNRKHKGSQAKSALLWGMVFFVFVQMSINIFLDGWHPEVFDLESVIRMEILRERIAECPDRSLLLMVGSSRTEMSFLPEELPLMRSGSDEPVLPFNFSHLGAGPVMNLLQVKRLLRAGIRPRWLVVEVMPPQLGDAKQSILHNTAGMQDLPFVGRYINPWVTYGIFVRGRLIPCYKHRAFMISHFLPQWIPAQNKNLDDKVRTGLGKFGGDYSCEAVPDADEIVVRDRTMRAHASYFPDLQDNFVITSISDRAMNELLELCRHERIQVALLLSPEGNQFQSWYAPASRRKVDEYCAKLSRKFEVPLIDARNWLPESDFIDSHHVLLSGAKRFTQRLKIEALQPLIDGKLKFNATSHSTASR